MPFAQIMAWITDQLNGDRVHAQRPGLAHIIKEKQICFIE